MTTIRVLVADDQMLVRQGFSVLLNAEPDITVVGQAVAGRDAVAKVAELKPDVVLMDIRMPVVDGIEATRRITAPADSTVKVLILTTFDLDEYVYEALRAGASGFLLKDASAAELAHAVRADGVVRLVRQHPGLALAEDAQRAVVALHLDRRGVLQGALHHRRPPPHL